MALTVPQHRQELPGCSGRGGRPDSQMDGNCRTAEAGASGRGEGTGREGVGGLRLSSKVLQKLGKLATWRGGGHRSASGRGMPGGPSGSRTSSRTTSLDIPHKSPPDQESNNRKPPRTISDDYITTVARRPSRISTDIRLPHTSARLSLDLPGGVKSSKRALPDGGRKSVEDPAMKKSTSTDSLSNLNNSFAKAFATAPSASASRPTCMQADRLPPPVGSSSGSAEVKGSPARRGYVRRFARDCTAAPDIPAAVPWLESSQTDAMPWAAEEDRLAQAKSMPLPPLPASIPESNSGSDVSNSSAKPTLRRVDSDKVPAAVPVSSLQGSLTAQSSPCFSVGDITGLGPCRKQNSEEELLASEELFFRLSRARQTMEFVRRQYQRFGGLDRAELTIFEALMKVNTLAEFEATLLGDSTEPPCMTLMEHAFQTAEKLRAACPDEDWLHLVGLMHGIGKILALEEFGPEPQWAIVGESFPVGCRFSEAISHHQLFYPNPDRRNRQHSSVNGIYTAGCGLHEVNFSWSGAEYLYLVLFLNGTSLPAQALYCIRYQKFDSLFQEAYQHLLAEEDHAWMPWLVQLRQAAVFERDEEIMNRIRSPTEISELYQYYEGLIDKYIGSERLYW
mmetsp:Transcript_1819/g.5296  ORF Transcript_1819/g.5296 Transcript_1819/m.5296 type:complete len:621 (+) Transcript_1819:386-2248(+)|eukprot:CAMPEP_0117663026 /NCGR_PEP_ID=MMETSP0804-20121206/8365_1 /TAXON_ID=1074897 /ORGANISM="Tetraselmis astigmatica, Strain CCMP880" /LENGTH=620 /DNA_ID=CAMNT_0005469961 /DNA_START=422 /DNA_END=2284 /DNA_ORIENTATION=+